MLDICEKGEFEAIRDAVRVPKQQIVFLELDVADGLRVGIVVVERVLDRQGRGVVHDEFGVGLVLHEHIGAFFVGHVERLIEQLLRELHCFEDGKLVDVDQIHLQFETVCVDEVPISRRLYGN